MPRFLLDNGDDTPTVTFPDDYPNSVRHFLLIGFLGMFIGAIVFFYMGISRKVNTVMHVLTFFIAAVSACSYYAEWAGLGVEYKTTDTTPRVIFWARYLDWVVTGPVSPPPGSAGRGRAEEAGWGDAWAELHGRSCTVGVVKLEVAAVQQQWHGLCRRGLVPRGTG